jgi:N-carbamoyl-L-amino-acid hydrolase
VIPETLHPDAAAVAECVSRDRLWDRHMTLARHGATADGGVDRAALSDEDAAARADLRNWAAAIGLEPSIDEIGNLFLRLPGREADADPVVTGSHLDSQPTGGRFDGVYGVLAGLEAVTAIADAGIRPRRPIDVVAWTNEEGGRFAPGMMGSAGFAGARDLADMRVVEDADGVSVGAALDALLAREAALPRRPLGFPVAAYIEAHIEQGPILEAKGYAAGVVTGIQGKRTFKVTVEGEEAHAGTTPRGARKDALSAAVAMIAALERMIREDGDDAVMFTVGRLTVAPNAPSVVPAKAAFSIDLRHPDSESLAALGNRVADICNDHRGPCAATVVELINEPSLAFPTALRDLIRVAADAVAVPALDITSAAGHDARYLHQVCPAGMIFVPCHKGISHNPAESATADDLAAGAKVLTAALLTLADS